MASVSGRTLPVELRESHAPHLSIHPNFSIFRNQGRQKMATFRKHGVFRLFEFENYIDLKKEVTKTQGLVSQADGYLLENFFDLRVRFVRIYT